MQNDWGLTQRLAAALRQLEVRKTERTGPVAALIAHRGGNSPMPDLKA